MNLKELVVITCDKVANTKNNFVPDHFHPYYELIYYVSGSGYGYIGNNRYDFRNGQIIIVPPFVKHSEKTTKDSIVYVISFKCDGLDHNIVNTMIEDYEDNRLLNQIIEIKKEKDEEKQHFYEKMAFMFGNLIIDLIRTQDVSQKTDKVDIIVVKNYLDNHFLDDIDYEYLSSKVFYSYDYLRHYFKKETGMSIKQYLTNKRIEYSKTLIFENMSIQKIAKKCHFSSASHYIYTFKKLTNQTPLEFKSYIKK